MEGCRGGGVEGRRGGGWRGGGVEGWRGVGNCLLNTRFQQHVYTTSVAPGGLAALH